MNMYHDVLVVLFLSKKYYLPVIVEQTKLKWPNRLILKRWSTLLCSNSPSFLKTRKTVDEVPN